MRYNLLLSIILFALTSCGSLNRDRREFMEKFGDDTLLEYTLPELDLSDAPMYQHIIEDAFSRLNHEISSDTMLFHVSVYDIYDGSTVCYVGIHEYNYDPDKSAGGESKDNRGYVMLDNHIFLLNVPEKYYKGFKEKPNEMTFKMYNKYFAFINDRPGVVYRIDEDRFRYIPTEEWDAIFND